MQTPQFLNPLYMKIYELICRNFLGSLSPNAEISSNVYRLQHDQIQFTLNQTKMKCMGYLDVVCWETFQENYPEMEKLELEQEIAICSAEVTKRMTQAPTHLTESDLLGLMEENGIGTDASMAQHIQNLQVRDYLNVTNQERYLIPTPLGIALIHAYNDIDPQLVSSHLRKNMEEQISLVAQGKLTQESLLKIQIDIYKQKYQYFTTQTSRLDFHFDLIRSFIEVDTQATSTEKIALTKQNKSDVSKTRFQQKAHKYQGQFQNQNNFKSDQKLRKEHEKSPYNSNHNQPNNLESNHVEAVDDQQSSQSNHISADMKGQYFVKNKERKMNPQVKRTPKYQLNVNETKQENVQKADNLMAVDYIQHQLQNMKATKKKQKRQYPQKTDSDNNHI